jgi:signal transduction histidine kinase
MYTLFQLALQDHSFGIGKAPCWTVGWSLDHLSLPFLHFHHSNISQSDEKSSREKQTHYREVLQRETTRLGHLIEDLLEVSRLDQAAAVAMEPVNPEALAADVVTNHLPQSEAKRIELMLDVQPNLPTIRANVAQMVQVLTNLLGNALAYTPDGGHVVVRLSQGERKNRPHLVMTVADDGPGISPEDLSHLFERFYRSRGLGVFILPMGFVLE